MAEPPSGKMGWPATLYGVIAHVMIDLITLNVKCLVKDFVLFCIHKKIFCLVCFVLFLNV